MAMWNKRFGLNAYYAGKHWAKRKEDAMAYIPIAEARGFTPLLGKRLVVFYGPRSVPRPYTSIVTLGDG